MDELIIFYSLAILVTLSSIGVICAKKPMTAATQLIFCLLSLSSLYAMQGSYFIAAIQIVIYAATLMCLLLFFVLYLKLNPKTLCYLPKKLLAMLLGCTITLIILFISLDNNYTVPTENPSDIIVLVSERYLWLPGLTSILIILTSISSVVITRRKTSLNKSRCL